MGVSFRKYQPGDYLKIRDFLVSSYKIYNRPYNWMIECWNFCPPMTLVLNRTPLNEWEDRIGIWEDSDGNIAAIVNSEGENRGEVYFQAATTELEYDTLKEMFEYAESNLSIIKDGKRFVHLYIHENDKPREAMAVYRGYTPVKQSYISTILLDKRYEVNLPEGFSIRDGNSVSDKEKGQAHAMAYGYWDTNTSELTPYAYSLLKNAPDYRPDLDLYIISNSGEIASFCTMWYDKSNRIGILEPVGTHPDYRKRGLGRAVIGEALNRIALEGAEKAYVCSGQDFYSSIGFNRDYVINIWEKVI